MRQQQQLIRQSKGKAMVDENRRHAEVQARARNGWANGFKLELDKEYLDNKCRVCSSSFLDDSYLYNSPPSCTVWRQICLTGKKYIGVVHRYCGQIWSNVEARWCLCLDKEGIFFAATEQLTIPVFKGSSGGHKNVTKPVKYDFPHNITMKVFISKFHFWPCTLLAFCADCTFWHWFQYLLLSHVEDVASIWLWDQKNLNTRLCFLMIRKSVALYLMEFFIFRKLARIFDC